MNFYNWQIVILSAAKDLNNHPSDSCYVGRGKKGAMLTHRAQNTDSSINQRIRDRRLFTSHQSRVTSYFFGLDSGGTIPLFR